MDRVRPPTLCTALAVTAHRFPDVPAISWAQGGQSVSISWADLAAVVREAAVGLATLGVRPGSVVSTIGETTVEQMTAELAALQAGAVSARRGITSMTSLGSREVDAVIVTDATTVPLVRRVLGDVPTVVLRGSAPPIAGVLRWKDLFAAARRASRRVRATVANLTEVDHDSPAALVLADREDQPLVEISHCDAVDAATDFAHRLGTGPGDRFAACLPTGTALQSSAVEWHALVVGATRLLRAGESDLGALRRGRPHLFAATLVVWRELADEVLVALSTSGRGLSGALSLGREVTRFGPEGIAPDAVVRYATVASALAAIRGRVGLDQCRVALVAEALAPDLDDLFCSIGLTISEPPALPYVSQLTAARGSGR